MQLREPCEHGRYESHPNISHGTKPVEANCPGGRLVEATRKDWCSEHGSMMQQTICEKYDLACRRVGKNPFAAKKPPCVRSSVLIVEEQQ